MKLISAVAVYAYCSAGCTSRDEPLVIVNPAEPGLKRTALGKATKSFYRSAGKDYKI